MSTLPALFPKSALGSDPQAGFSGYTCAFTLTGTDSLFTKAIH
jgi:hypothetical protein